MGEASNSNYRIGAIIAAAGSSQRMNGTDKILYPLAGKPVLAWVVDVFQACSRVDDIVIVLNKDNLAKGREISLREGWNKVSYICEGGTHRQDSVWEGLQRLHQCYFVVIHDGARPCLTVDLIERGLVEVLATGAAIAAIPVADTIKQVDSHKEVLQTLPRAGLWVVQTPQVFKVDILIKAYSKVRAEVTDDASLVEKAGYKVKVFPGSHHNIKITTREDLALAEAILAQRKTTTSINRK